VKREGEMAKRHKNRQTRKQPRAAMREHRPRMDTSTAQQAVIGEAAGDQPIYTMWGKTGLWFAVILLSALFVAAVYFAFSHPTSVGKPF
jgi:hypothetical protein